MSKIRKFSWMVPMIDTLENENTHSKRTLPLYCVEEKGKNIYRDSTRFDRPHPVEGRAGLMGPFNSKATQHLRKYFTF